MIANLAGSLLFLVFLAIVVLMIVWVLGRVIEWALDWHEKPPVEWDRAWWGDDV